MFWAFGVGPVRAYQVILQGSLLNARAAAEVVRHSIPLLLAGVGLVLAFRAQFWNIGAEGQILAGAVTATWVALFSPVPLAWRLPIMFAAGFLGGGLWALIPTLLKLRLAVNEVISTLMMNYVALYMVDWLVHGPWKGPEMRGFAFTNAFPAPAWIPTVADTRIHWPTLALGIALAAALAFLLARTRLGFEIRVQGANLDAAHYSGISPIRTTILAMLIGGGAAGIAGVGEVGGIHHRLLDPTQISLGYGYAAIIVAWLARGSPLASIATALFLGLVFASGDAMRVTLQMPARVTDVFNGLILFCLIGSERLMYYRVLLRSARTRQEPLPAAAADTTARAGGGEG